MRVSFEEKTYEIYFNLELNQYNCIMFPPGQVIEGVLGFDLSVFSLNPLLWEILNYPLMFNGCSLKKIAKEMDCRLCSLINNVPEMEVNLLFQYKKPEYMKKKNATYWGKWGQPFYKYNIYKEQQDLLMNIDNNIGRQVLILYAAPAINTINDLIIAYKSNKIIQSSNFTEAHFLNNHHINTYIQYGNTSKAFSYMEDLPTFDLLSFLEKSKDDIYSETNYETNYDFIISFANEIKKSINNIPKYKQLFITLNEQFSTLKEFKLLYSFLILNNFINFTGLQWLIKTKK